MQWTWCYSSLPVLFCFSKKIQLVLEAEPDNQTCKDFTDLLNHVILQEEERDPEEEGKCSSDSWTFFMLCFDGVFNLSYEVLL